MCVCKLACLPACLSVCMSSEWERERNRKRLEQFQTRRCIVAYEPMPSSRHKPCLESRTPPLRGSCLAFRKASMKAKSFLKLGSIGRGRRSIRRGRCFRRLATLMDFLSGINMLPCHWLPVTRRANRTGRETRAFLSLSHAFSLLLAPFLAPITYTSNSSATTSTWPPCGGAIQSNRP